MTTFDLLAAIDLRDGAVVRLRRGDFDSATRYASDPVAVATDLAARGARWLHVVDLDAARAGGDGPGGRGGGRRGGTGSANRRAIADILATVGGARAVEVGGGLRSTSAVDEMLSRGARRAVLGTAALDDPDLVADLVARHGPERIAIALDVRAGAALGHGWVSDAGGRVVTEALARFAGSGARWFEVTAIDRDGTLEGPDLELLRPLVAANPGLGIIASGGIRIVEDVLATRALGCAGAIVGRAIYEGTLDLGRAIRATTRGLVRRA